VTKVPKEIKAHQVLTEIAGQEDLKELTVMLVTKVFLGLRVHPAMLETRVNLVKMVKMERAAQTVQKAN